MVVELMEQGQGILWNQLAHFDHEEWQSVVDEIQRQYGFS